MANKEQEKELLKQFLTYNLAQDYDDKDKRAKFLEIFGNLLMSDSDYMKPIVLSMFSSFNKYNEKNKPLKAEEEPADNTENSAPAADNSDNGPSEEDLASQFEAYKLPYIDRVNDMLGW